MFFFYHCIDPNSKKEEMKNNFQKIHLKNSNQLLDKVEGEDVMFHQEL